MQHRLENGEIRLRAGMRLHIGVACMKQFFSAVDRQLFGHIHMLAAAVVALAGVTLGVLVGEHRTLRHQHARAGVIFRGNQLNMILLTLPFCLQRLPQCGVQTGDGVVRCREHGAKNPSAAPGAARLGMKKLTH